MLEQQRIAGLTNVPASMGGLVQAILRSGGDLAEMRNLAPLPKDAQELIDQAVVDVGLDRLTVARRVIDKGLTFPMPGWLGIMELYWEKAAKIGDALRTMTPGSRAERQMPDRDPARIPIYATLDDFSFHVRVLLASQNSGAPLDVSMVQQATRRVNESVEDAFIFGADLTVNGISAPGLLNAPNAGSQNFIDNESWTDVNHSGEDILADVLNMITVAQSNKKYGPYDLFVPTEYGIKLSEDFKANSDKTIRQRLMEIDEIDAITVADLLPGDATTPNVVLVQMTSDVIDAVMGQEPTTINWTDGSGWMQFFVVMACMIPRVKDDYDGQSGIVIGQPGP